MNWFLLPIHTTPHLEGVQSVLFLLVIPISLCSFLTFYGVKSDDDCAPFHCRGRGVLLHMQLEILLVGLVKFVSVN